MALMDARRRFPPRLELPFDFFVRRLKLREVLADLLRCLDPVTSEKNASMESSSTGASGYDVAAQPDVARRRGALREGAASSYAEGI